MKKLLGALLMTGTTIFGGAQVARAGGAADAALGLGAFAVFNQLVRGETVFHGLFPPAAPVFVQQPVVVQPPIVVQQPVVVQPPIVVQQPVVVPPPIVVQRPVVIRQPVVVAAPPPVVVRAAPVVVAPRHPRGYVASPVPVFHRPARIDYMATPAHRVSKKGFHGAADHGKAHSNRKRHSRDD
jgi:hypothetical protein